MENLVRENLEKVFYLINEAKEKSVYKQNVNLVAVSKTVDVDKVKEAKEFGLKDFGENRPQELVRKYENFKDLNWHQIGTLQKNKVKYIIDKVKLIHSLDSYELASVIDKKSKEKGIKVSCLVQVNISNEQSKHGIKYKDAFEFTKKVSYEFDSISVCGLMAMAPYEQSPENTRPYFKKMKELFEEINSRNMNDIKLKHLSMGMSNDYQIAIEEGATIVRLGTIIFGERIYI